MKGNKWKERWKGKNTERNETNHDKWKWKGWPKGKNDFEGHKFIIVLTLFRVIASLNKDLNIINIIIITKKENERKKRTEKRHEIQTDEI